MRAHSVKLLLRLLRPQRRRILVLLLVILGATAAQVLAAPAAAVLFKLLMKQPFALRGSLAHVAFLRHLVATTNAIFQGSVPVRLRALLVLSVAFAIAIMLRAVLNYWRIYLGQYVGGRTLIELRTGLFARLQRLSLAFYESQRVGDLMSRLTSDVALVQQMISEDMTYYLMSPLVVLGCIAYMLAVNWRLTVLVMVFAPLTAWVVAQTGRRIRRLTRSQQERVGDLNARLHERLASMRVIQSFAREDHEIANFRRLNENTFTAAIRVARVNAFSPQAVTAISALSFVIVLGYAGVQVIGGRIELPGLFGYFIAMQQAGVYFVKFGTLHLRVQQSLAALGRIMEVMEREPDVREAPDAVALPPVEGRVTFRHVSFRYAAGEEVLQEINLEIAPGEMVALVGPSGAGKTSLANLVMRLYDPTEGAIEIDGHDLRRLTFHSLRSQIGLVPQETVLFGGTIRENVLYGRMEATEEEVAAAARAANAHDFIVGLPQGYDTEVGERAVRLSGGQRQRLAVARALLKDPRILILDEATSSLDTESEALVQEALERLMVGRTTLVIAHRLSTIRKANRIIVLSEGRLVEQGSHADLLARKGLYHRLYGLQREPAGTGELVPETR